LLAFRGAYQDSEESGGGAAGEQRRLVRHLHHQAWTGIGIGLGCGAGPLGSALFIPSPLA
jgi:hypothetical protein